MFAPLSVPFYEPVLFGELRVVAVAGLCRDFILIIIITISELVKVEVEITHNKTET